MMCEIISKLPDDLKRKVLSYKQSPPHFFAMKYGLFPIRDSLLKIDNSEPTISLHESETEDEISDLDEEWYIFYMELDD